MPTKADYVRAQPRDQTDPHTCHAEGCQRHIKPSLFMCREHWRMVPASEQSAIWRAFRPGQEIDKPIRPENLGLSIVGVLTHDERRALHVLDAAGVDVMRQSSFWEAIVARLLGGELTSHKAFHDIDVSIWGRPCRIEVKFASAVFTHYRPIRGEDWSRHVFKWAKPRGNSGKRTVDAIVLLGNDAGIVYTWVVPLHAIRPDCRSITVCAPRDRTPGSRSSWDAFAVPATELLPSVARICHNILDLPMRKANAAARRRSGNAAGDLFV